MSEITFESIRGIDARHVTPDQRTTVGDIASATFKWTTPTHFSRVLKDAGYRPDVFYDDWRSNDAAKRFEGSSLYQNFIGLDPDSAVAVASYLDERLEYQRRMSSGTLGQRLLGTVLGDPFLAAEVAVSFTPAGGIARVGSLGRRALMTGGRAGLLSGSVEGLRQAYLMNADPTTEFQSAVLATATAATFGAVLGGPLGVPAIRAEIGAEQALAAARRISDFRLTLSVDPQFSSEAQQFLSADLMASYVPRDGRPLKDVVDVSGSLSAVENRLSMKIAELRHAPDRPTFELVANELEALAKESRALRQELLFRRMDEAGLEKDINKIFRPSGAADNPVLMHTPGPLRWVMRSELPNKTKLHFLKLIDSTGIQMRLHEWGVKIGPSVENLVRTDFGKAAAALDDLDIIYRQRFSLSGQGENIFAGRDVHLESMARRPSGEDFDSWINEVNRRRILGEAQEGELEEVASRRLTKYFEDWEKALVDANLLHTKKLLLRRNAELRAQINDLQSTGAQSPEAAAKIARLEARIEENSKLVDARRALEGKYGKELFFPRRWDINKIKADREGLAQILFRHYTENPEVWEWDEAAGLAGEWKIKRLSTEPDQVRQRVEHTIDGLLGKRPAIASDSVDQIELATATQKARTVGYRQLDIPNSLVIDYLDLGVRPGIREYNGRVARKYRFAQQFGRLEDALEDLKASMSDMPVADQQKARMMFVRLYNRVSGRVLEDPTALNQKAAQFLRDSASFAYLGSAGLAATADFGKVIAEFDNSDLILGLKSAFDKELRNASIRETRIAGSAAEMAAHTTMARITGDMYMEGGVNAFMEKARSVFNVVNLLGPVTVAGKLFTGMLSGHRLIEDAVKVANGTATRKEIATLARFNIGYEQAKQIASMPWERTENGLILPNTEAWPSYAGPVYNGRRFDIIHVSEDDADMTSRVVNGQYQPLVSERTPPSASEIFTAERSISTGKMGDLARFDETLTGERAAMYREARRRIYSGDLEAETVRIYELPERQLLALYGALANAGIIEVDTARAFSTLDQKGAVGLHKAFADGSPGEIYVDTPAASRVFSLRRDNAMEMATDRALRQKTYDDAAAGDLRAIHSLHIYENFDKITSAQDYVEFVFFHEIAHGIKNTDAHSFSGLPVAERERAANAIGLKMFEARRNKLFTTELTQHFRAIQAIESGEFSTAGTIKIDRDYIEANVWPAKPWANPPAGVRAMDEDQFADVDEYVQFLALREMVRIDKNMGSNPTPKQINLLNREALKALRKTSADAVGIVEAFRAAVEAEGSSTVIAATAGERPLMMDGVLHLREDSPLAFMGHADPMTPGYVRIENGFIGLPLQFYSFAFAGVNKVTGQFMQNSVRNRTAGLAAMFALGYMISHSRTPDFVWERMPPQDRLVKAFDQSGIAALYSDAFYTLMQLGNTGFGVNISGGMFAPRFREEPNALDAATGIAGASSGWALGMGRAAANVATGNFGPGVSEFLDNMWFQNVWLWKQDMNELSRWYRQ